MTNRDSRQHLSAAELDAVLSYVRTRADLGRQRGTTRAVVDELIVLLLAGAGLRPHELCILRMGDLPGMHPAHASPDEGRGDGGEATLWIRDMKGGIARKVNISEDLAERLARFVRLYRSGAQEEDLLLENERGGPLSYMSLYSKIRRIGREAGIAHLSPAALRRAYVQQLYEVQRDLRYVQEQAGYRNRRSVTKHFKANGDEDGTEGNCLDPPEATAISLADTAGESSSICEACGAIIAKSKGGRIESGQLLCGRCLEYFRRP